MVKRYMAEEQGMVESEHGCWVYEVDYIELECRLRAYVDSLKKEKYELASAAADWAARNIILKADLAELITALGEYHQAYTDHSEFISESGFDSLGFVVCEISPASRATAERFLPKKDS